MKKLLFILFTCLNLFACAETNQLFVLTIPKSGTYLTAKAIWMLTGYPISGSVMNHFHFSDSFLLENPNIRTTAHLVENFEPLRTNMDVKKILVIRDLRDVCVSAVYWLRENDWYSYDIDHSRFYKMDFENQLSYMINLTHNEYSIKSFAKRAILWMNTPGVLTIRFEDLIGEKGGGTRDRQIQTLKQISDYLEVQVPMETLEFVADHLWGGDGTFRQGKSKSWKTSFKQRHVALLKHVMGEELEMMGYDWE